MKSIINRINNSKYIGIIVVIISSIIASLFLFKVGIIKGHDLEYHLSRITSIANLIKIGDFKALIHEGINGYGYANGLCYPNLFLYFPALLTLIGINAITSYKIYIFIMSVLTSLSMYFCVKKITKSRFSSMISSILYVTCSYRICDVMVRAALGESLSFIFIPIIILGLYYLIYDDYKKYWVFALGFVGLLNSHLITTIIMVGVSLLFIIFNYEKILDEPKRIKYFIYATICGTLLAAFFLFPFLEFYVKNAIIVKEQEQIIGTIGLLESLCGIPKFTTRFIPPGIGFIFIYFIYNYIFVEHSNKKKNYRSFYSLCNIIGIIVLLLSTTIIPWTDLSKYLGFIQFTWRMFVPVSALLSFVAGYYFEKYLNITKYKNLLAIFIIIIILICPVIYQYFSVKSLETYYKSNGPLYLTEVNDFSIAAGEYMLKGTDWSLLTTDKKEVRSNNDIEVEFEDLGSIVNIRYDNNSKNDTYIDIPKLYYIGYKAINKDTKQEYKLRYGYNNWIRIFLNDSENGNIKLYYSGTTLLKISYLISLISWIMFIAMLVKERRYVKG